MNKPFVTIFILIYNNADGLEETVTSVLSQDYTNAEVILSDDGSTNYDTAILDEYAARLKTRFSKVSVNRNEKNLGTVKHLNRVISLAEGKYLYNCCSGDRFYRKDTITRLTRKFEKSRKLILAVRREDVYPSGKIRKRPSLLTLAALKWCPAALLEYMICRKNVLSGCCTFCARELFETYGYYDESYRLVEDYPYYVKLLLQKVPFAAMPLTAVSHGIGGVSTGKVHPAIYQDIEMLREKLYECRKQFSGRTAHYLETCHQSFVEKTKDRQETNGR